MQVRSRMISGAQNEIRRQLKDVGLSPLFLIASGLVTDLGGPLSHAAIVAREYGVPAVVNVEGATRVIRTGERLRVDGDRGIVEKIGPPGASLPPPTSASIPPLPGMPAPPSVS